MGSVSKNGETLLKSILNATNIKVSKALSNWSLKW